MDSNPRWRICHLGFEEQKDWERVRYGFDSEGGVNNIVFGVSKNKRQTL